MASVVAGRVPTWLRLDELEISAEEILAAQ